MNIKFLKLLAKKEPALARLIELSIISWAVYILWATAEGNALSLQAWIQACLVPLIAYLSKLKRDLDDK